MYKIVISRPAARALKKLKLAGAQKQLIIQAIDSLADNPHRGCALRRELKGFYKLRVGNYQIVYEIRKREVIVSVIGVGHRKDIYNVLARRFR